MTKDSPRLELLEAMRGIAACWVALHHANLSVSAFVGPTGNAPLIANGLLGVNFFFVLSGFIIAFSTNRMIEGGRGLASYLQSRILRIYIPYLPVGVGILLLYWLMPGLSASERTSGVATSLSLFPTNEPPALSVAWTLVHEVIFYALFATIFFSKRLLYSLLGLWAVVIVGYSLVGAPLNRAESYLLSPLNLCFHLGIAISHLIKLPTATWVPLVSGALGAFAVIVAASLSDPNALVASVGFGLLVFAAASRRFATARVWQVATMLGAASYSVYLIHNPTLSAAVRIARLVDPSIDPWVALVTISIISIGTGVAYWFFFERWALQAARTLISKLHFTVKARGTGNASA